MLDIWTAFDGTDSTIHAVIYIVLSIAIYESKLGDYPENLDNPEKKKTRFFSDYRDYQIRRQMVLSRRPISFALVRKN